MKKLSSLQRKLNTTIRKITGQSDYQRWGVMDGLAKSWDSRTMQIAKLIEPGASVIEFGAGRLVLKAELHESCAYTPSDLVDRGVGTIICDLNSETLPQFQSYDIAVFSGVLEYVNDVPRLISHLANYVNVILASYAITEKNRNNRRSGGWVNDYSLKQFVDVFAESGFDCVHTEEWHSQVIFKFVKRQLLVLVETP